MPPTQRPHHDHLIQAINAMSIFQGLGVDGVAEIAQAALWRDFAQGGIVFLEEEASIGLCHLYSGWLKVVKMSVDGREQVLRYLGPGETFNEVGVLARRTNPATVIALEQAGLWIIPREAIHQVVLAHPELAMRMLENMANRAVELVNLVGELSLHSVEARLARYLLGKADDGVMPRQPWATYAELAARLGTVPDVFSRALRSLSEAGLIQVDRRSIRILDRAGLEDRAGLI